MKHSTKSLRLIEIGVLLMIMMQLSRYNLGEIFVSDIDQQENKSNRADNVVEKVTPPSSMATNEIVRGTNVSQFDVRENAISSTRLRWPLETQNQSLEVPSGWTFEKETINIGAIYKGWSVGMDLPISKSATDYWSFYTNYPSSTGGNFYMAGSLYSSGNIYKLQTSAVNTNSLPGLYPVIIPTDALGLMYQTTSKPRSDIGIMETDFVKTGELEYPVYDLFTSSPSNYNKNYTNPYGGSTGTSTRTLEWRDGGYLDCVIQAGGSNLTLGNPSIAWDRNFSFPVGFSAKKVELSLSWSVSNLGYEAADNMSVIARIDNSYVDGRTDSDGNKYLNATATTIETDTNATESVSHGYISRLFDVTNLINKNLTVHNLDFGVWLQNINDTQDAVQVCFDAVIIRATEVDQYKVGEISFDCNVNSYVTPSDWLLFYYLSDGMNTNLYVINSLASLGVTTSTKNLKVNFTTRDMDILNASVYTFGIGFAANAASTRKLTYQQNLFLDNFNVSIQYQALNLNDVGLKYWNSTGWTPIPSQLFDATDPYSGSTFTLAFKVTNQPVWNSSYIQVNSKLFFSKIASKNAFASYYFDETLLSQNNRVLWNVTYNNTATIMQLKLGAYLNFNLTDYNFTIVDAPAFDNLGSDSLDWKFLNVLTPQNLVLNSTYRTAGSSEDSSKQNLTIVQAYRMINNYTLNGTWVVRFDQQNYLNRTRVMSVDQFSQLTKVYSTDSAKIVMNLTSSFISDPYGYYNLTIKNSSQHLVSGYPIYSSYLNENWTHDWAVIDQGVGVYSVCTLWNDTTIQAQTLRIGMAKTTIEMWRTTYANLTFEPDILISGTPGQFRLNFSQTVDFQGISGASSSINLFLTSTDHVWGTDWPPFSSKIDSIFENSTYPGNYTIKFKTSGVAQNNYAVYINITMPFFDIQTLHSYINITGLPMKISIVDGFSNDSGRYFVDSDNIPYVNDTQTSLLVVNVTTLDGVPLQDGLISGIFNASSLIFYGKELYTQTHEDSDLGLYTITLDTRGLNSTERDDIADYNLTLTVSVPAYEAESLRISCPVKSIPTQISCDSLVDSYEGGSFRIYASFKNILNPQDPLSLNYGTLIWTIKNNSDNIILGWGSFEFILSGVYRADVDLDTLDFVILPGIYSFVINGTQLNCANASWCDPSFVVYEKDTTLINIIAESQIRIGQTLNINAKLMFVNGTAISGASLSFLITYANTDSFTISKTTDSNGVASYSQIIPYQYADKEVIINITYAGSNTIRNCSASKICQILGKYSTILNLMNNTIVKVGYTVDILGRIQSENPAVQYSSLFITLAAWYDNNVDSPIFIRQLACNSTGYITYTTPSIQPSYSTITFFMDYSGSASNAYNSTSITLAVLPKWECNISMAQLAPNIRIGQTIVLNFTASFVESQCPESFFGLPLVILFEFVDVSSMVTVFFNINYSIGYSFEIPQAAGSQMNITFSFASTSKINGFQMKLNFTILPKWMIRLNILEIPTIIRLGQTLSLNIFALFDDLSCTEQYFGIPIQIHITAGITKDFSEVLNQQGYLNLTWTIPESASNNLNISISTSGTSKIGSYELMIHKDILPQITTKINLLNNQFQQGYSGEYYFSVALTDENDTPLKGQEVFFIIKNEQNIAIKNYSAITNDLGIAAISIKFEDIGTYSVNILFTGYQYYDSVSSEDSGVKNQIRIVNISVLIVDNLLYIAIALASVFSVGLFINRTVIVPRRLRQREEILAIHRKFADIENVQYFLIIHKGTGISIFSHAFTQIPIDETLISGFLSAIGAFGQEIGNKVSKTESTTASATERGGLEELGYKQFKIVLQEGKYIRTAVLLLKTASPSLKEKIVNFIQLFETNNTKMLEDFGGLLPEADPIMELIEQTLNADLLYPHNVVCGKVAQFLKSSSKKSTGAMIVREAQTATFNNTFKVREILNRMTAFGMREVDSFNSIYALRKEGIVFAVNPRTQFLIEKFKPLIEMLSQNARMILLQLFEGNRDESKLKKLLKGADLNSLLDELRKVELIRDSLELTESGDVIATLMNLIPEFNQGGI